MNRMVAVIGLLLLVAATAWADKVRTVKSLTAADFPQVTVTAEAGTFKMCGQYQLKDSEGATVGNRRVYCKVLTAAQKTALIAFIRDDVGLILSANQGEGLEP